MDRFIGVDCIYVFTNRILQFRAYILIVV